MKTGIIYKATSPSGKSYIGQTIECLDERIRKHKYPRAHCRALKSAIDKYGDKIEWSVIEEVSGENKEDVVSKLNELEVRYIKELNTIAPNGYNLRDGGDSLVPSKETLKKMSEAQKIAQKGKKLSEEHKRKISIAHKGRKLTEEHKRKLSKSSVGKKGTNTGKTFSKEWREKISIAHKGKKMPPFTEEHKRKLSESLKRYYAEKRDVKISLTSYNVSVH